MPGRHEKQRVKRKRSKKREPLQQMEKLVKESWVNRQNKETSILNELLPVERIQVKQTTNNRNTTAQQHQTAAAAAGGKKKDHGHASPDLIASVARGRKDLAEENWMSKNRYANKIAGKGQESNEDDKMMSNRENKVAKTKLIRQKKTASPSAKLSNADASAQKNKSNAERLLASLAGQ